MRFEAVISSEKSLNSKIIKKKAALWMGCLYQHQINLI